MGERAAAMQAEVSAGLWERAMALQAEADWCASGRMRGAEENWWGAVFFRSPLDVISCGSIPPNSREEPVPFFPFGSAPRNLARSGAEGALPNGPSVCNSVEA
jgi:hypothetical protein